MDKGVPQEFVERATKDYYEAVLLEVYEATIKNGGSWTNSLAAIALGLE